MLGTGLRYLMSLVVPSWAGLPWSTLADNLIGSFLLGLLLQTLLLRGPDSGPTRLVRLSIGTGALGGYTTFSQFALDLHGLLAAGRFAVSLGYLAASVGGGLVCALAGSLLAARLTPRPGTRS